MKRKRPHHEGGGYRSNDSRLGKPQTTFIRNPSDSSEVNYADNEEDSTSHRLSPSTQLSTNDSDIFSENFESDSYLSSGNQFPPPPSDLLTSQPLFYNSNDSNPLLSPNNMVDMSIPTPALARKKGFHPNQYLVDYQFSSDHSEVESIQNQNIGVNDLELSALSSVEEEERDEEDEGLISPPTVRKAGPQEGKPPKYPPQHQKRTSKRSRNKSLTKRRNRDYDRHRSATLQPLVVRTVVDDVTDDVTTPTTQSSDVTTPSGRDESVIDR